MVCTAGELIKHKWYETKNTSPPKQTGIQSNYSKKQSLTAD